MADYKSLKSNMKTLSEIVQLQKEIDEIDRLAQIFAGSVEEINFSMKGRVNIKEDDFPDTENAFAQLIFSQTYNKTPKLDFDLHSKISESIAMGILGVFLAEKRGRLDYLINQIEKK